MPKAWTTFKIHYRYRQTVYHITLTRVANARGLSLDGQELSGDTIPLVDDQREHAVEMSIN
jgi:cellobiose phosphorylase